MIDEKKREEYKKELENKKEFHELAMMEFTDLLKKEGFTRIIPQYYEVLGIILTKFKNRITKNH